MTDFRRALNDLDDLIDKIIGLPQRALHPFSPGDVTIKSGFMTRMPSSKASGTAVVILILLSMDVDLSMVSRGVDVILFISIFML